MFSNPLLQKRASPIAKHALDTEKLSTEKLSKTSVRLGKLYQAEIVIGGLAGYTPNVHQAPTLASDVCLCHKLNRQKAHVYKCIIADMQSETEVSTMATNLERFVMPMTKCCACELLLTRRSQGPTAAEIAERSNRWKALRFAASHSFMPPPVQMPAVQMPAVQMPAVQMPTVQMPAVQMASCLLLAATIC